VEFVHFVRRPVWLVVLLCLGCSAQSLSPEANRRIEQQIRAHFKVPDAVQVTIGAPKHSEFAGYDSLPVTFQAPEQKTTYEFLLSKDGKKLLRLTDIDISPEAYAKTVAKNQETQRQHAELMKKINVAGRPWRGAAAPKVTIVVYDDFQCPYCAAMYKTLFADGLKEYGDRVRIILKDFPLFEIHPWAKRAAIDSNCLAEQSSDAYWDFADYAHTKQSEISGPEKDPTASAARLDHAALDAAKKYKLDEHALQACLKAQPDAQLNASVKEAESLGVSSTPTLFINGDKTTGALTEAELRQEILAALRNSELPAVAASTPPVPPAAAPPPAK
jgi:protein-disulfide isomerase